MTEETEQNKTEKTQQSKKIHKQLDRLEEGFIKEEIDKEMFIGYKQKLPPKRVQVK